MSMSEECDARDEHLPDRVEGWVNVYGKISGFDRSWIVGEVLTIRGGGG